MTVKTQTVWGRMLTEEETELNNNKKLEINQPLEVFPNEDGHIIREFATAEEANAWIAFTNTFDPPPVSSVIVTE